MFHIKKEEELLKHRHHRHRAIPDIPGPAQTPSNTLNYNLGDVTPHTTQRLRLTPTEHAKCHGYAKCIVRLYCSSVEVSPTGSPYMLCKMERRREAIKKGWFHTFSLLLCISCCLATNNPGVLYCMEAITLTTTLQDLDVDLDCVVGDETMQIHYLFYTCCANATLHTTFG
jgi:hypothetical protein